MKYRRLSKKLKKNQTHYLKVRQECERELLILFKSFKDGSHSLSDLEVYKEIKRHISAEEKELNYAGARTIPMSLGIGVLVFITNTMVFDSSRKNSVMYKFNMVTEQLKHNLEGRNEYWLSMIVLMGMIFLPIGFVLGIFTFLFTLEDGKIRKKIYKQNIMSQLLDEKIDSLKFK